LVLRPETDGPRSGETLIMSAQQKKISEHNLFKTGYFVAGQWKTASETFDVDNSATGEVVAKVARAGKAETEAAIKAASDAFPAWRKKTGKQRLMFGCHLINIEQ